MKDKGNIDFVARHYRADAFSRKDAWNAMGLGKIRRLRRLKAAAAVAGIVAFTAAAAIFVHYELRYDSAENAGQPPVEESTVQQQFVTVLDFDNASLPEVLECIRTVYGQEVENVPDNAGEYRLTLHYEGNAADLVDTINDILGTEMSIKK